jgi:hypothetical protein
MRRWQLLGRIAKRLSNCFDETGCSEGSSEGRGVVTTTSKDCALIGVDGTRRRMVAVGPRERKASPLDECQASVIYPDLRLSLSDCWPTRGIGKSDEHRKPML